MQYSILSRQHNKTKRLKVNGQVVTYTALLNHHVLLELTEKLALEKRVDPLPFKIRHVYLKMSFRVPSPGMVLLPANYNREETNSKIAQVEMLCTWEWLKGEPFSTGLSQNLKPPWKSIHGAKAQSGTPADCLNFPWRFLLGVVSARFDDVIYLLLFVLSLGSRTGGNTLLCLGVPQSGTPAGCLNWFSQLFLVIVYKPSIDGVLLFVPLAIYSFTLACSILNKLIKSKQQNKQTTKTDMVHTHLISEHGRQRQVSSIDGLVYTVSFRLARRT